MMAITKSFYGKIRIEKPQQCANTLRHGQSIRTRLTMTILPFFDAEKYFLDNLCKHGHDWENTGKSLYRIQKKQKPPCLECERVRSRKYRAANPEKSHESVKKYRQANPEVRIRNAKAYSDSGKQREATKRYRDNHSTEYRKVHAEHERLRRFKKRTSKTENYSVEQVRLRFAEFGNCCAYCGTSERMSVDHFVPIKKDGTDSLDNIIPACFICNSKKKASDALTWYRKQEFYSQERWDLIMLVLGKEGE
jgi:5-methylcytosine-specific restriction endonuclease McrA